MPRSATKKPASSSPRRRRASSKASVASIEYHVIPDGRRWDVERDGTFTGQFAYDKNTAIGVAVRAAQNEYAEGKSTSVCVEEDGHCTHVWP